MAWAWGVKERKNPVIAPWFLGCHDSWKAMLPMEETKGAPYWRGGDHGFIMGLMYFSVLVELSIWVRSFQERS